MTDRADKKSLPTARLRHCAPGQWVILLGDKKPKALRMVDDTYGYFDTAAVSLSHPVNSSGMEFVAGGWRAKCTTST